MRKKSRRRPDVAKRVPSRWNEICAAVATRRVRRSSLIIDALARTPHARVMAADGGYMPLPGGDVDEGRGGARRALPARVVVASWTRARRSFPNLSSHVADEIPPLTPSRRVAAPLGPPPRQALSGSPTSPPRRPRTRTRARTPTAAASSRRARRARRSS
eukprot:16075-Pelagococcus_subviridis.AAC.1